MEREGQREDDMEKGHGGVTRKRLVLGGAVVLAVPVLVLAAVLLLPRAAQPAAKWGERAELAQDTLLTRYWDDGRQLFNNAEPCLLALCTDPFNYWWQAHAVDTLTDGYLRSGEARYKEKLAAIYQGLPNRNAGVYPNDYYDDMEWMALAWLRAFEATGVEAYKETALVLWREIQGGWNEEQGGGIAWRREQLDYKNTPANAPAVILAARLFRLAGDPRDLEWAERIYRWQKETLVDPESGLVWDGINRLGDGRVDKDWRFTYGQGVYIGAGVELFRATGDEAYLEDARRTSAHVREALADGASGVLPGEGDGDGALFKGVLVRYLGELIALDPDDPEAAALRKLLLANADSLWAAGSSRTGEGESVFFSNNWSQPPEAVVQLSAQLSGMMLLEQAARLEHDK